MAAETVAPSFFPVTNYIYGQIEAIKDMGVNPIKIDSTANKLDTTWLKIEDFAESFKEFVNPQIDSLNLVPFFEESKFADQTIDAYTFTYTPSKALPDSILLLKWDVYISPATNTVKRVFIVKRTQTGKELQLTWQSDKWCKIVTIVNKEEKQFIESEQTIKWNFD
ncbi:MAG: hypothetical protein H7X88_10485 [Gloeobacteraceae cyanobacterium ES-bin-316]|nr:hypothetical protein [Ferruginibacter sp.]